MLGQAKFVRDATLAYATPWCMTMSHSNTRYGGEKPADPIRFWTKNPAGVFKQISLPPESLEGSILRLVVSKFILYRRQGKNGVMLELGKDIMVLKNGGVKVKKILDFPSMNMMSCDAPEMSMDGTSCILETEGEHTSLSEESAPIEYEEDVEDDEDDAIDDDEEEYTPPAKKQRTHFETPRRKTRSAKKNKSP